MIYRGFELDPFQSAAIEALGRGASVLVSAPTGNGKTVVADWIVERALARGRSVIYTAPIKALSNQKFRDWCRLHGEENVGLLTGDLVIRREAPCRVMTTEILRNMLLVGEPLPDLDAVVLDEIHFLDDRERGTTWEEVLIYLPPTVQVLGLSATLQNIRSFASWLGEVRGAPVEVVEARERVIPLRFHVFHHRFGLLDTAPFHQAWKQAGKPVDEKPRRGRPTPGKRGGREERSRKDERQDEQTSHLDLVRALDEGELLPCLYFAFSRKITESYARELSRRLRRGQSFLSDDEAAQMELRLNRFRQGESGGALDEALTEIYQRGIAFHHAGLSVPLKALVEELYELRLIKVLYCTSTFALGINMPARTAAFDALMKYDGQTTRPLTAREFMQKAGRAGRRGLDTEGHVVIRADLREWARQKDALEHYLSGKTDPVSSSFSLSFHSIVNLLHRHPADRIRSMVERSFLSWTRRQEVRKLEERASALEEHEGKALHKLQKMAAAVNKKTWDEVEARIRFLQDIGYLAEDRTFNAGATILKNVQIEEIFVTELILSGLLEGVAPPTLFGLLCAVNKEFPRDARLRERLRGAETELARAANRVRHGPVVTRAEAIVGITVTWCPEMIPYGRLWAEGKPFLEIAEAIQSTADVGGDLIGAFRRAKDLIGQLRLVYAGDHDRVAMLTELGRAVSRDEVLVVD